MMQKLGCIANFPKIFRVHFRKIAVRVQGTSRTFLIQFDSNSFERYGTIRSIKNNKLPEKRNSVKKWIDSN